MRTLDLGCGPGEPRGPEDAERWGIDVQPGAGLRRACDLALDRLSFPDNWFERVYAHDLLEHLPKVLYVARPDSGGARPESLCRRHTHVELFNEVYRVLTPGGVFESCTPTLPGGLDRCYGDPTHASTWHVNSWNYFAAGEGNFEEPLMRGYGYTARFRRVRMEWVHGGGHLLVELAALK